MPCKECGSEDSIELEIDGFIRKRCPVFIELTYSRCAFIQPDYAVVVKNSDDFWLKSFKTEEDARIFVKINKLPCDKEVKVSKEAAELHNLNVRLFETREKIVGVIAECRHASELAFIVALKMKQEELGLQNLQEQEIEFEKTRKKLIDQIYKPLTSLSKK